MRVLFVEDEVAIANVVKRGLERANFDVDHIVDGAKGLEAATERSYAVLLLDLMLPTMDGWTICETLRDRQITTPILMLTARDSVRDRIRGLDTGADDYLPKPFDFNELLARVRALIRRDRVHKKPIIKVCDLEIDTVTRQVTRAGSEILLTPREFDLLDALASHEGQVLTRDVILQRVWTDDESLSNTVDVHIRGLRKKIDTDDLAKLLHRVHGLGYVLRAPAPEDRQP